MPTSRFRRQPLAAALAAALISPLLLGPPGARAATVQWLGGSGSFSDFTHWSGGFVPNGSFDALLGVGAAPTPSVTVRLDDFSATLNQLTINSTGIAGTFTLLQDKSDSSMVANVEIIGSTISGNAYVQSAGSNQTGVLTLGYQAGGSGQYQLSGSGNLSVSDTLAVGGGGSGAFAQSGGTLSVARILQVGGGAASLSTFALSAGNVNIGNNGFVEVQPASGRFDHSGGTLSFAGFSGILIGASAGNNNPAYNLTGTGRISGAAYETIGFNIAGGTATFAQAAGTNALAAGGILTVGDNGAGVYSMNGGVLQTTVLQLGAQGGGFGVFAMTGGVVTVAGGGEINIGKAAASSGNLSISNGIGQAQLSAPIIRVGGAGSGSLTQSNGAFVAADTLTLGDGAGASGVYVLNGGSLLLGSAASAGTLNVGLLGNGSFTQTGGSVAVQGVTGAEGSVQVGRAAGTNAVYAMKGGSLVSDRIFVGALGFGTFVQSGGTVSTSGSGLFIGAGADGGYGLSTVNGAATLTATVETVGGQGDGLFSQTGNAEHHVKQGLFVGAAAGHQGTFNMGGGSLDAAALQLGGSGGSGQFQHSAGSVSVIGNLLIAAGGSYALGGGTLTSSNTPGSFSVGVGGSFSQSAGQFNGTLSNGGSFTYSGGNFAGRLINGAFGSLAINGALIAGQGVSNQGSIVLGNGITLGSGSGGSLDNQASLVLAGGALAGAGAIVNNAGLSGFGAIGGSGGFSNRGSWTVAGGNVVLTNSGANANQGSLDINGARQLQLIGATLANRGVLSLNAGLITGSGTLTNEVGGTLSGVGTVAAGFVNQGVVVPGNGALVFSQAWANAGVVNLTGPFTGITGAAISNTGSLQGAGNVGAAVNNNGSLEAIAGTLVLTQPLSNGAGGRIAVDSGAKLLAQGGLASNNGLIVVGGGSFDAAGPLANNGQITGWGSLSSGGLINSGTVNLTGGVSQLNGSVINNAGRTIQLAYNPATFTGTVTNNGTLQTIATTVVFAGGLSNNGVLTSGPAVLRFSDLSVGATGVLAASSGDRFEVSGSFVNLSSQAQAWHTGAASLLFDGVGNQTFVLAGRDVGADPVGYDANFAWGRVELAAGAGLSLRSAAPGGALYTGAFVLDGGLGQLAAIHSAANIYYDAGLAANGYLGGASYALSGGGTLAPVPEPGSWALFVAGLLWLHSCRRLRSSTPT